MGAEGDVEVVDVGELDPELAGSGAAADWLVGAEDAPAVGRLWRLHRLRRSNSPASAGSAPG
ncbi:hypothetical protein ACFCYM_07210 [Streptomyces sp. NPDC056254]|uniref:hypothetical protein n=1 Tax=Streptomyces sp. NPDC056254 TaxID=3345763 RepID=UPI0035E23839